MMFRKLFIFSIISLAILTIKIRKVEEARDHFFRVYNLPQEYYLSKPGSSKIGPYTHYFSPKGGAHLINVQLYTENERFKLAFTICKKSPIVKELNEYDPKFIEIQSKAFLHFTQKMVTYEEDVQTIYFNMIEDVKSMIQGLEKQYKLTLEEVIQGDIVYFKLSLGKILIGKFDVTSVKIDDKKYQLIINYSVIEKQQEIKHQQTIDVITDDESHFANKMNTILDKFKLSDYVNVVSDATNNFYKFFESSKSPFANSKIKFSWTGNSQNDLERSFNLISVDQTISGKIGYRPNETDPNNFGFFELILNNGEDKIYRFNRMKIKEYFEFLQSLNLGELFEGLYEKIKRIYENSIKSNFSSKKIELNEKKKLPGFFSSTTTSNLMASVDGQSFSELVLYEEGDSKVKLVIETQLPSYEYASLKFKRKSFRIEEISRFIEVVISSITNIKVGRKVSRASSSNSLVRNSSSQSPLSNKVSFTFGTDAKKQI